jgi:hypothetical protein
MENERRQEQRRQVNTGKGANRTQCDDRRAPITKVTADNIVGNRSWKPEVQTNDVNHWATNSLRFATQEEAEANVQALMDRWWAVTACRASPCSDPVTHAWVNGQLVSIEGAASKSQMKRLHGQVGGRDGR